MTSRRGFLATLAAAFVADPERLLWKPGAKLISIPKLEPIVIPDATLMFYLNAVMHVHGSPRHSARIVNIEEPWFKIPQNQIDYIDFSKWNLHTTLSQ